MKSQEGGKQNAADDPGNRSQQAGKEAKHNQQDAHHVERNLRLALGPREVSPIADFRRTISAAPERNMSELGYHSRLRGSIRLLVLVVTGAHQRSRPAVAESEPHCA